MNACRLVLASASPRRRQILERMGLCFDVVVPVVDEVHWDDDPAGTVVENATRKCTWARARHPGAAIIAADTVVVFEGKSIGKPPSRHAAAAMLRRFSGHCQSVYTGVAMAGPQRPLVHRVAESLVHFRVLSEATIQQYIDQVDPVNKAGGYDIDQHGDLIIQSHEGSWTNIMGLPREVVEAWLSCK